MNAIHYYRTFVGELLPAFQITLSTPDEEFRAVLWIEELELFVAVGNSIGAYSTDGITWMSITVPTGLWRGLAWSPELGRIVAVASSGNPRIMTSEDGINWTSRTPPRNLGWSSVAWSPYLELFCAGRANNSAVPFIISSNGIIWQEISTPSPHRGEVIWNLDLELFISLGHGDQYQVMASSDGVNWDGILGLVLPGSRTGFNYIPQTGIMYSAGVNTSLVHYSYDAVNWGVVEGINSYMHNAYVYYPPMDIVVAAARARTPTVEGPRTEIDTSKNGTRFKENRRTSLLGQNYAAAYSPKYERIVFAGRHGIVTNNI